MPEPNAFTGPEQFVQERNTPMATARPVSCEADGSLAGDAALVRPASPEALNMAHASLTADMAVLHATLKELERIQLFIVNRRKGDSTTAQQPQQFGCKGHSLDLRTFNPTLWQ